MKNQIIILLPVVTVFVIAMEFFDVHGVIAALFGLLTIPITTYLITPRHKGDSNEALTTNGSVEQKIKDSPAQLNQHSDSIGLGLTGTLIILGSFLLIGFMFYSNAPDAKTDKESKVQTQTQITHPDYISASIKPLVDYDNEIKLPIPLNTPLWVESTNLKGDKRLIVQISYQAVVDGQTIFKLADVVFPGVAFLTGPNYSESCLSKRLNETFDGQFITIDWSDYPPVVLMNNTDIAEVLVRDGYGDPTYSFAFSSDRMCTNSNRTRGNDGVYFTNTSRISEVDRAYTNCLSISLRDDLSQLHQLAKVKKSGAYGQCDASSLSQ
jgi:hypothetical protein